MSTIQKHMSAYGTSSAASGNQTAALKMNHEIKKYDEEELLTVEQLELNMGL